MHRIVQWLFLPSMLVGFTVGAVWSAGRGAPKWQLVALLMVAIGWSFLAERLAPYDLTWNQSHGDAARDVVHGVVNESLQLLSLFMLPVLVDVLAIEGLWPSRWPFWLEVIAAVAVLDAGVTFGHWWSHRWSPLWRLHSVHHSVTRFYGFNGLMKHPLHQLFETSLATAPLVIIGLPVDVATALVCCVAIQLLVQHSNVDYRAGAVRWLIAVNQVHRFHHLKWSGVGDVNFGLFFTVWDRLLGTAVWDPSKRFSSAELGIAAEPEHPSSYIAQLRYPFRPARMVAADVHAERQ